MEWGCQGIVSQGVTRRDASPACGVTDGCADVLWEQNGQNDAGISAFPR